MALNEMETMHISFTNIQKEGKEEERKKEVEVMKGKYVERE